MRSASFRNSQIDWSLVALRWLLVLCIFAVTLLTFSPGGKVEISNVPQGVIGLLLGAALYNLVVMVLLVFEIQPRVLPWLTLVADALLAVAFLVVSGGASSRLLFFSLLPILSVALRFNFLVNLMVSGSLCAVYYFLLNGTVTNVLLLVTSSIIAGWIGGLTRRMVSEAKRSEEENELHRLRSTREQARAIFEMASTLSATLNYQRILDAVLDVSVLGLKEIGPSSTRMVSLVLLLAGNGLNVAASRHLTVRDEKLSVTMNNGSLSKTLASAEPVICNDPAHDPELTTYSALHRCQVAVCVPLRAGFENYGVAIFASPDPHMFTPDNIDVLMAVCNQAIIALQNAQLFASLQAEKARIVEIEEDARKKLARDLHDGPTQSVAAIAMRINYTRTLLQREPLRVPEELEKIENLARSTTKEIRHMLFTLRPLVLESQGLKAALETLVQKLHDTEPSLEVHLELDDLVEKLDKDAQGMTFYVVEEAIGNARKHAESNNIWVRTCPDGEDYLVEIKDDGVGFDVGKVQSNYDKRGSLGMINMHERAEVLKAKLSIASAIGQGTRVSMRIPIERVQA